MNNNPSDLKNHKIVVVGGAGLLGSRICDNLVLAGAKVAIADVSRERAEAVAARIETEGGVRPLVCEVSITDPESVATMINECHDGLHGITGLINTAYPRNKNYGRKFEDVQYQDFCENVDLHLGGYFLVSQKILAYYKAHGGGCLLNMSSIYGVMAPRFEVYADTPMTMPVEYAAIKSAIVHLTKYMAKYFAGNNIRVNCLSLGGLLDKQPEAFLEAYGSYCIDKGMLEPDDLMGTIRFLMSDASRYLNGQNLVVDDGFSL